VGVGATGSAGRRVGHGPAESGVKNGRPRRAVVTAVGTWERVTQRETQWRPQCQVTQRRPQRRPCLTQTHTQERDARNGTPERPTHTGTGTDPHKRGPHRRAPTQETHSTQTTDTGRGTQRSLHTHSQTDLPPRVTFVLFKIRHLRAESLASNLKRFLEAAGCHQDNITILHIATTTNPRPSHGGRYPLPLPSTVYTPGY